MRVFATMVAALFFAAGSASAGTISVANGDFEDAFALGTTASTGGKFSVGATGYDASIGIRTFQPSALNYSNVPAGTRVGLVNGDGMSGGAGTLSQSLGVTIEAGVSYSLSALIGNRLDYANFGGVAGFFAGDPSNVIAQSALIQPAQQGVLEEQAFVFDAIFFQSFIGQTLGFFFAGTGYQTQFTIDNISVAWLVQDALDPGKTLVNPIPGAVWLFGTALAAAGAASRRKKARA